MNIESFGHRDPSSGLPRAFTAYLEKHTVIHAQREPLAFYRIIETTYHFLAELQAGKMLRERDMECFSSCTETREIDPFDEGFISIQQKEEFLSKLRSSVKKSDFMHYIELEQPRNDNEGDDDFDSKLKAIAKTYIRFLEESYKIKPCKKLKTLAEDGITTITKEVEDFKSQPSEKRKRNAINCLPFILGPCIFMAAILLILGLSRFMHLVLEPMLANTQEGQI